VQPCSQAKKGPGKGKSVTPSPHPCGAGYQLGSKSCARSLAKKAQGQSLCTATQKAGRACERRHGWRPFRSRGGLQGARLQTYGSKCGMREMRVRRGAPNSQSWAVLDLGQGGADPAAQDWGREGTHCVRRGRGCSAHDTHGLGHLSGGCGLGSLYSSTGTLKRGE
jgi:hypothetical protein